MKVICAREYALFLMNRYRHELSITWDHGVMTIAELEPAMDLVGVCGE